MKFRYVFLFISLIVTLQLSLHAQQINQFKTEKLDLIYFGKRYSYAVPHVAGTFENALSFHEKLWGYRAGKTNVLLGDFEDYGHGGAIALPFNQVQLGIEPYSYAFNIVPSNERFQWLFNHELTHVVMADKANKRDRFWRSVMFGKIRRTEKEPLSALWSYLGAPRWYSPRWYHEGIACFMETWMSGGLGRTMGTYDEMYFRSIVNENLPIYSMVGLETEGTTVDFQVGANSYLYGTRFITYLAYEYGIEKLKAFYSRTDDSKAFYAAQFKQVYGESIHKVWNKWKNWEYKFQQKNIDQLKEYPLTPFDAITANSLGNVSKCYFNSETRKIYAAVNYPGTVSHLAEINYDTGKTKRIAVLDSPTLYNSTQIAYAPDKNKLFISEQNNKIRSLVEVDIESGKKKTLIPYSRTGDLVYNSNDRCLWGIKHDNGLAVLVKIPEPYTKVIPYYTAEFGKVMFDLAISNKGDKLSATITGIKGDQSLILFDLNKVENGAGEYETIFSLEDNTLNQFRFSQDDQHLIGISHYTGVSNIWRVNVQNGNFELLSNTETGFFMPLQLSSDSLFVLKFSRDGMIPGTIPLKVLNDANAIEYLGNQVVQKNTEVKNWSLPPASKMGIDSLRIYEGEYNLFKEMKLANAYPDIAGFKNTLALGYRLNWRDPIGLNNLQLFLATSPWSDYQDKQKFHVNIDWKYKHWNFLFSYNKTDFYDLFGPTKKSRAGYAAGIHYRRDFSMKKPFEWHYDFGVYTLGDLEVLPQYQNVQSPIKNIQQLTASVGWSKLRKTLGGVIDEKGYSLDINGNCYYAEEKFYPSIISNQNIGWLVPGIRNTSFWVRNSIGQSMGDRNSALSHFYFGGFRNNYVDWQPSEQYRETLAFPGAEIDEIPAWNFVKTMGELNLKPIRLRNVGTSWLYPTYIKTSAFGTHLMTDFDKSARRGHYFNIGAQVDIQLVLFSYLKTTWSLGYAKKFKEGENETDKIMLSLRLLGD